MNGDAWRMRVAGGWIYMLPTTWNGAGSPVPASVFVPDPTGAKVSVTEDKLNEAILAATIAIGHNYGGMQDFDESEVAEIAVRAALEALGAKPPRPSARGFTFAAESTPCSPDGYADLDTASGIRPVEVERGAAFSATVNGGRFLSETREGLERAISDRLLSLGAPFTVAFTVSLTEGHGPDPSSVECPNCGVERAECRCGWFS